MNSIMVIGLIDKEWCKLGALQYHFRIEEVLLQFFVIQGCYFDSIFQILKAS